MKRGTITNKFDMKEPNIIANWLALLLCIQEVQGSNLGIEPSHPHCNVIWLFSALLGKCQDGTLNYAMTPFTFFPIHSLLIILSFSVVYSDLLTALLRNHKQINKYNRCERVEHVSKYYPFYMGNIIVILLFLARPTQDREIFELTEFAISRGFHGSIQLWDLPYWRRKQHTSLFRYGNFL
jgi:hypothetical protein